MKPILSICIPTYNRVDILRNTIASIYADLAGVSLEDFEVVVSDNSKEKDLEPVVAKFTYENLHYYSTNCEGFKNSFYAMSYGKGDYLKLNNDYTTYKRGTLKTIINQLKSLRETQTQVIYTNGLRGFKKLASYDGFDAYMAALSYFSSWSAGYGMWKDDFDAIKNEVKLDKYFPQTSLLLTQNNKQKFVLDDRCMFEDQHVPKKGGYNIFKVFSIDYLNLINKAFFEKKISRRTHNIIKNDLLYKYLSVRYFKTAIVHLDNFDHSNMRESVLINYSKKQYFVMLLVAMCTPLIVFYRKFF